MEVYGVDRKHTKVSHIRTYKNEVYRADRKYTKIKYTTRIESIQKQDI